MRVLQTDSEIGIHHVFHTATYSMYSSRYYGTGSYNLPCLTVLELVP